MKLNECPECGCPNLRDLWVGPGRTLQQWCEACPWEGDKRVPEQLEIKTKKMVGRGRLYDYEIYDRFGHAMIYSRSYNSEKEAEAALKSDMAMGKSDKEAGPYTAVLWPPSVEIEGKVYKDCPYCSGRGWWIIDSEPDNHSCVCKRCDGIGIGGAT